jgi:RNA binding exosome subunit
MGLMGNLLEDYTYSVERSRQVLKIHEQLIHLLRTKQHSKTTQVLEAHIKDTFHLFHQRGSQGGNNERSRRKKSAEGGRRP